MEADSIVIVANKKHSFNGKRKEIFQGICMVKLQCNNDLTAFFLEKESPNLGFSGYIL